MRLQTQTLSQFESVIHRITTVLTILTFFCNSTFRMCLIRNFYCALILFIFYSFGAWQPSIIIHFHCMEKISMSILQNISFCFQRKEESLD